MSIRAEPPAASIRVEGVTDVTGGDMRTQRCTAASITGTLDGCGRGRGDGALGQRLWRKWGDLSSQAHRVGHPEQAFPE